MRDERQFKFLRDLGVCARGEVLRHKLVKESIELVEG